jgi:cbb3-type cytochrome oxidase maturation protein
MNILLVLIPVTLLVIVIAVALFFWAVNHQQFDDLDSPGVLPLMDDPVPEAEAATAESAEPGVEASRGTRDVSPRETR